MNLNELRRRLSDARFHYYQRLGLGGIREWVDPEGQEPLESEPATE